MPKCSKSSTPEQPDEKPSPWRTAETFRAHVEVMRAEAAATGGDQLVHEHLGGTDGALTLRVYPSRIATWFLRYHLGGGHRYWKLGPWGSAGLPLGEARRLAVLESMRRRNVPDRDLHAEQRRRLEQEAAERAAREAAAREAEDARRASEAAAAHAATYTVRRLFDVYIDNLEARGKRGSRIDARSLFRKHVVESKKHGYVANLPANKLAPEQVTAVLRELTKAKKRDTARKLRAYLHAAYKMACRAALDPEAPEKANDFAVTHNPVADVPFTSGVKARNRVLSEAELRVVIARLRQPAAQALGADVAQGEARGAQLCRRVVLLSLMLGGQRPGQVLRLTTADVVDGVVTLLDPKGRRSEPRIHQLPLIGEAAEIVTALMAATEADAGRSNAGDARAARSVYLFSTSKTHAKPMRVETLSKWAKPIIDSMVERREVTGPFQLRDLRRTAETMLAAEGVSKDIRAQIQSHGLGGVQDKHYDRHDYLPAKRHALIRWHARLKAIEEDRTTREPGEVVDLSTARGEPQSEAAA
jgi:hypothetical protein